MRLQIWLNPLIKPPRNVPNDVIISRVNQINIAHRTRDHSGFAFGGFEECFKGVKVLLFEIAKHLVISLKKFRVLI